MVYFRKLKFKIGNLYRYLTRPWLQLEVPVEKVTNIFGCNFGPNGWHPIVETIREYETNRDISFEETTLFKYHNNFEPSNTNSLLNASVYCNLPLFVYPWGTFSDGSLTTTKEANKSRFCGPSSNEFISKEYVKIIDLYEKIKGTGYQPEVFPHSYMGGTVLKRKDGDFRFVVMQGNHRMAVFSFLGYNKIAVRLIGQALHYVREEELLEWPGVRENLCTADDAQRVFDSFFEEDGQHIKSRLPELS